MGPGLARLNLGFKNGTIGLLVLKAWDAMIGVQRKRPTPVLQTLTQG